MFRAQRAQDNPLQPPVSRANLAQRLRWRGAAWQRLPRDLMHR
jgi:hypothetical protein